MLSRKIMIGAPVDFKRLDRTMTISKASHDHLRKIFTENFSARDIGELLVSFDDSTSAADVRALMEERRFEVVGVRHKGVIAGYARRDELGDGKCGDVLRPFDEAEVAPADASFPTIIALLRDRPRLFLTSFGQVGGIVSRSDLQKPPVRMWLFGMVTIVEMGFVRLIESRFPDDTWQERVSDKRLEKAKALLEERQRRNQELGLMDCLQFSDKGQIVVRDEQLRNQVGFVSRRRGEETIKAVEALRNSLAHSQDILARDWETIVALSENLDRVLAI
jgi:hypothetical protein